MTCANKVPICDRVTFKKKDERDRWPFVRWIESRQRWMVDARTKVGGQRRFFETKDEALGWRAQKDVNKQNEGNSAFDDTELRRYGWTVQQAIKFAVAHLEQQATSKPVAEAVAALLDFKRSRVGEIRLADIGNRLARLTEACGDKTVAQVTPDDINAFLATIPHPTTRNDYRKEIIMLWHFCRARKWVLEALDKTHVPREVEPEKGRVILTV